METKVLLDKLEEIECDRHNMTRRTLTAIIEEIETYVANPSSFEEWVEYEQYGRKRYAKLVFNTNPTPLVLTIEQSGTDGVYATYFQYEY